MPRFFHQIVLLCLLVLAAGCGAPQSNTSSVTTAESAAPLNVFAASSLADAFGEIGTTFEAMNAGTKITFNFAGSQQLAQQIAQGAAMDVFAPASIKQMDAVIDAGSVTDGSQRIFVGNRLVMIYPKDNPADLKELKDLAKPGVKLDLAAREVPVGQYTLDFFDKASADPAFGAIFKDLALKNVVSYEENVKAVLSKVMLGEADAGIVYSSDITNDANAKVGWIDIPDPLNTIANYPIAPIKASRQPELAEQFIAYVLSPEAQLILSKHGFIPVRSDTADQ